MNQGPGPADPRAESLGDAPGALGPDPVEAMPAEVARGLEPYRNGDVDAALAILEPLAASGRTATAGHALAALAGIELGRTGPHDPFWKLLGQVAAGEDPWLGPLAAVLSSADVYEALETLDDREPAAAHPLARGLIAQLTGDQHAARADFEQAAAAGDSAAEVGDFAHVLLGNLLLTSPDPASAEEPLTRALASGDALCAGYAGHLLGHLLIARGDLEHAGDVLWAAHDSAHPVTALNRGLFPWVCVRLGETLATTAHWDPVIQMRVRETRMSEGYWVRDAIEGASVFREDSRPALTEIGLYLFPRDFDVVRDAMDRLRRWSPERYDRGRRLSLAMAPHAGLDEREHQTLQDLLSGSEPA